MKITVSLKWKELPESEIKSFSPKTELKHYIIQRLSSPACSFSGGGGQSRNYGPCCVTSPAIPVTGYSYSCRQWQSLVLDSCWGIYSALPSDQFSIDQCLEKSIWEIEIFRKIS